MNCKVCGSKLSDGARVCELCGSPIETASTETAPVETSENINNMEDDTQTFSGNDPFANVNPIESSSYPEHSKSTVISDKRDRLDNSYQINFKLTHGIVAAIIAVVIAGIVTTCILYNNAQKNSIINEDTHVVTDNTTNNISGTTPPTPEPQPTVDMSYIDSIISANAHNALTSVSVIDLKHGISYSTTNANTPMSASALTTVPIIYVADIIASDANKELRDIQIPFKYTTSGRGCMTQSQNGQIFDLELLINNLLSYSDNNISNTLMDYFGMQEIGRICKENGYSSVAFQRHIGEQVADRDNYISAADAAEMLAELYNRGKLINAAYLRNRFIIADSIRYDGLGKYLPSNITFLSHNAFTNSTYNEVCIIPDIKNPYILAFLSNNGDYEASKITAAKISEYVFGEFYK